MLNRRKADPPRQHNTAIVAPKHINGITSAGGRGRAVTAPPRPATYSATHSIHLVPSPITHSAGPARPTGARRAPITPAGITRAPMTGTTSRFASRPYCAIRLKCAAASGEVATEATSDETSSIATGRSQKGIWGEIFDQGPADRISATVAAKLIWKPGWVTASGE